MLHLIEIAVTVVPLQGRLIVVRPQSLAEELGKLRRAADDYDRYVSEFPLGSFAMQARDELCALDPARCRAP